jgi:hypothetical protein
MAAVLCQLIRAPDASQYLLRASMALCRMAGSPRRKREVSSANMRLVSLVI